MTEVGDTRNDATYSCSVVYRGTARYLRSFDRHLIIWCLDDDGSGCENRVCDMDYPFGPFWAAACITPLWGFSTVVQLSFPGAECYQAIIL